MFRYFANHHQIWQGPLFLNGNLHKGVNLATHLYLSRPAKKKWNALQQQILHWRQSPRVTSCIILDMIQTDQYGSEMAIVSHSGYWRNWKMTKNQPQFVLQFVWNLKTLRNQVQIKLSSGNIKSKIVLLSLSYRTQLRHNKVLSSHWLIWTDQSCL